MTHVFAVSRRLLLLPISPVAHQKQQLKKGLAAICTEPVTGTLFWFLQF